MFKKQNGFTLIEMMITLVIMSVVIGYAVPSFNQMILNTNSRTFVDDYFDAITFARTEALKRGKLVTLCPANTTNDNCGNDWKNGWLVVLDTAATEATLTPVVADANAVIRKWEKVDTRAELILDSTWAFIRFNAVGVMARVDDGAGTPPSSIKIKLGFKECNNNTASTIKVALSGMITVESLNCAELIPSVGA